MRLSVTLKERRFRQYHALRRIMIYRGFDDLGTTIHKMICRYVCYILYCLKLNLHKYETFHSLNEREEFMQETQHTQQTATRTAQNQDKKTT